MSEYTKEFDDWWYKPLLDSAKWSGGVPDKDMMRYKDLGKQSAFHAWVARDQEITRLKQALEIANEAIGFYELQNNWLGISEANPFDLSGRKWIRIVEDDAFYDLENREFRGGKRAREAQKQIKELLEG